MFQLTEKEFQNLKSQFVISIEAIRQLMTPPDPPRNKIGFEACPGLDPGSKKRKPDTEKVAAGAPPCRILKSVQFRQDNRINGISGESG
jgi:hypothetical protein